MPCSSSNSQTRNHFMFQLCCVFIFPYVSENFVISFSNFLSSPPFIDSHSQILQRFFSLHSHPSHHLIHLCSSFLSLYSPPMFFKSKILTFEKMSNYVFVHIPQPMGDNGQETEHSVKRARDKSDSCKHHTLDTNSHESWAIWSRQCWNALLSDDDDLFAILNLRGWGSDKQKGSTPLNFFGQMSLSHSL